MRGAPLRQAVVVARSMAVVAAGTFLLGYLVIAALRMNYPFELEWMEGGVLDHVRMAASGRKIFAEPSLEFISFLYPPLYYYVGAVFAAIFGMEFFALRLLSFVSSLGCLALIFAIVRRETGAALPAALAACLYVATFDRSGGWMDIARVDSLFMFLLLAGVYLVAFSDSWKGFVLAGLVLGCAASVKQSAVVICLPLGLYFAVFDLRRGAYWMVTAFVFTASSWLLLDQIHEGWFRYYCFTIPSQHPLVPGQHTVFWTRDMLPLALAFLPAISFVAEPAAEPRPGRRLFYVALAVGMLGSSWSVTSAVGAWQNNLMPAFAAVSILAGLGLTSALRRAREYDALMLTIWLLVSAQFALLAYSPREHLPTAADRAAGEAFVERLREIDGEVFIPHHGYLAQLAGKGPQAHTLAFDNLFLDDRGPIKEELLRKMRRALWDRRYAAAFVESDKHYHPWISAGYTPSGRVFEDPDVLWPVTGGRLRPEFIFLPRPR